MTHNDITLDQFEEEQWNHVEDSRRKHFVWFSIVDNFPPDVYNWIDINCSGRYFSGRNTISSIMPNLTNRELFHRIWFENKEEAVLFGLMYGCGDPWS